MDVLTNRLNLKMFKLLYKFYGKRQKNEKLYVKIVIQERIQDKEQSFS